MGELDFDIKNFNAACDDFLNGKYIVAENKISSILNEILKSDRIKNIVSEAIKNYNFTDEFKRALGENQILTLPDGAKDIVAFVFSLLYNIDNKNIKFYDFLNMYFGFNDFNGVECYKKFAMTIILPFKEAMNNLYLNTYILTDSADYNSNIYNKIKRIAELGISSVDSYSLKDINKEELLYILTAMKNATEKNDKVAVYALLVAMDYFSMQHKKTKVLYAQFKECFE